jgi:hypothetical protein
MKRTVAYIIPCFAIIIIGVTLSLTTYRAHAVTATPTGQALELGPPVLNLSGNPGDTITANVMIRDVTAGSLIVTNQVNDFVASGEDGTPKILLDSSTPDPYSLKDWISPLPQLLLKTHELHTQVITIAIPKNASPGGYYGVVRFTGVPPDIKSSGVSLSASIGSLILLTVKGDAKENLSVAQFYADDKDKPGTLFETAPITFVARIKNDGNIHEQPAGLVTVKDMFNNVVATLGVNQPPRDILPGSIRKFTTSIDSTNIGNKILFGLYHARLDLKYGTKGETISSDITFWVIPYRIVGFIIAGLIAGFFILRALIKRYNRAIIARAKNSGK